MKSLQYLVWLCLPALVAGCANTPLPPDPVREAAPRWHAPLPHDGSLTDLSRWWQQQGDEVLVQLIDAAQQASPTVATAAARIVQARAAHTAATAALLPTLDAAASVVRSSAQPPTPQGTTSQAGLQTAWEIDLFGANRNSRNAAQARLEGAQAGWHEARVAVAAEVATQYYALRSCEKLLDITISDAGSRTEIARLSELSAKAGFQAPATAALARASAAEGRGRVSQQRASCDLNTKALVALTAIAEPDLRAKLAASSAAPESAAAINIASLPAQVLAQRPDIYTAEREVAAAAFEIGGSQAQRFPRLTLSGNVGAANFRGGGIDTDLSTWSIGPLALSLPLFDGGRRAADVEAARARYDEAVVAYRAKVRQAVREVEEALVSLQSTGERSTNVVEAAQDYRVSFTATEDRYRNGLVSLVELEDTRRSLLAAEIVVVSVEQERRNAWLGLYRAAGGGWNRAAAKVAASNRPARAGGRTD